MLEKGFYVLDSGGVQVLEVPVEIVRVGIPVESLLRQVEPVESAVRLVQHVDADFLLHDVALVVEILGGEIECLQTVGFQPENRIERGERCRVNVCREIEPRESVDRAAATFHHAVEGPLGNHRRTLEHHVFEQMREAGPSLGLKAKADSIGDAQAKSRRRVVF